MPGLGIEVNGNRTGSTSAGLRLQPSELAKLALVLWGADVYARKRKLLGQWQHIDHPARPGRGARWSLLVLGQHDLGTALVLIAIVLALLWVVGVPLRLFAVASLGVVG